MSVTKVYGLINTSVCQIWLNVRISVQKNLKLRAIKWCSSKHSLYYIYSICQTLDIVIDRRAQGNAVISLSKVKPASHREGRQVIIIIMHRRYRVVVT